jgi:transposase
MAGGKKPDADSLASLAAWAGLNPADYSGQKSVVKSGTSNTLVRIASTLREDPNLTEPSRVALEEMIKAAYANLAETRKST